ncbi:hypothetical protein [Streptomyces sp. Wb2n-11]|uniref:hypothetical protein n=1 Tax=Streptomyces sp. Wb2n-11 TaxID=1030533 RepID=UPI000B31DEAA|nr:hypothetical protein [Streptomyces sp. Wb2n-11]
MGKSTSDTFRDLLGGITDDLKEAFDDIIDYDEWDRRRGGRRRGGRWRRRDDDGRWYDRDDDHWRQREDDGRWYDRDDDHWRGRERDRFPRRAAADLPRQSRRGETEQEDLKETVQALRSELNSFVEALRETSVARGSSNGEESRRT